MLTIFRRVIAIGITDICCVPNVKNTRICSYQSATAPITSEAAYKNVHWKKYRHQRLYCQFPNQTDCWNCKTHTKKVNNFLCSECGKLQDITKEYDYFQLLSVPRDYDLPGSKLTKVFRQLQTMVHPDKFSNKSEREQQNSAEWSALINKAYKTLSNPMLRGQYLLKLQGDEMPNDNSTLNKEFLMEMMERNEEVDEARTSAELNRIGDQIQREIQAEIDLLTGLFRSNNLQKAKEKLVKMKYLLSIQTSIKTKLEKLMDR